jgi:hypothetical protein
MQVTCMLITHTNTTGHDADPGYALYATLGSRKVCLHAPPAARSVGRRP